jgi:hypothetical protein
LKISSGARTSSAATKGEEGAGAGGWVGRVNVSSLDRGRDDGDDGEGDMDDDDEMMPAGSVGNVDDEEVEVDDDEDDEDDDGSMLKADGPTTMKCSKRWPSRLAGFVCVELLRWEVEPALAVGRMHVCGGACAIECACVVRVCVWVRVCGGTRVRWYACAGTVRHVDIPLTNQV